METQLQSRASRLLERGPLLSRLLFFIIIPVLLTVFLLQAYWASSLPNSYYPAGSFSPYRDLSIERNELGVPHILAHQYEGAYFGLGVAHAQDRLWQMELLRRKAAGRLSEVYGESKLHADKFSRTLGFYLQAQKDLTAISEDNVRLLNAYSAGINYWLSQENELPLEFILSGIEPQSWEPIDTLAIFKLYSFELNSSFHNDYKRFQLLQLFGRDYLLEFASSYLLADAADVSGQLTHTPLKGAALSSLIKLESDFNLDNSSSAHNGIAVSPKLVSQNKSVLAYTLFSNTTIPSRHYVTTMHVNEHKLSGATLPGVPAMLYGENSDISWVGSPAFADTQDLFIEQPNPAESAEYLSDGEWTAFEKRVETIKVKAKFPSFLRNPIKDVELTVASTSNGPLLSEVLGTDLPVSVAWTGFNQGDTSFDAIMNISRASDWGDFVRVTSEMVVPAMHFLYADKKGNIGLQSTGNIPVRTWGTGKLPLTVGSTHPGWSSHTTQKRMDPLLNPGKGWLTFADAVSDTFVSNPFYQQFRDQRMFENQQIEGVSLTELNDFGIKSQPESRNELLALLLDVVDSNYRTEFAIKLLKEWQDTGESSTVAEVIYAAWLAHYRKLIVVDAFSKRQVSLTSDDHILDWVSALSDEYLSHTLRKLRANKCHEPNIQSVAECTLAVDNALQYALEELSVLLGDDMKEWTLANSLYGDLTHSVLGRANIFSNFVNKDLRPELLRDNWDTRISHFRFEKGITTAQTPSLKVIHINGQDSVTNWRLFRAQSGNVISPWYKNRRHDESRWVTN